MNNKKIKLTKAFNNFNDIMTNCKNNKFNYLDNWILKMSEQFIKDNFNNSKRYLKRYRPGTIVYIDFGIGIGSELSGPHLAIVLSKNDTRLKRSITIIPLTSKCHPYSCFIEQHIFDCIMERVNELISLQSKTIEELNVVKETYANLKENESAKISFSKDVIEYMLIGKKDNFINFDTDVDLHDTYIKEIEESYARFNNDSYAKLESITTIDKSRIYEPLNILDPLGKIKISDEIYLKIRTMINERI